MLRQAVNKVHMQVSSVQITEVQNFEGCLLKMLVDSVANENFSVTRL